MPKVLSKKLDDVPAGAVSIGRPSIWGSPFVIGKDGTRDAVIAKFEAYLLSRADLLAQLQKFAPKDLACWCAPARFHCDILVDMANPVNR